MSDYIKMLRARISRGDKGIIHHMNINNLTPQDLHYFNTSLHEEGYKNWGCELYPVTEAASHGHLDIMNAFIKKGFDPDNKDFRAYSPEHRPLFVASRNGHLHIVKCLIEDHNVNLNPDFDDDSSSLLSVAIRNGHFDIVKYLIESGSSLCCYDAYVNVLHECVIHFDPKFVEHLLSKGVNVNEICEDGNTPLILTPQSHFSYSNALVLLDAGANVNAKNDQGDTTFLVAAAYHQVDLMRLLISRGADPNVVNKYGYTAIDMALHKRQADETIKYLVVELGLECLNTRNSDGTTFTMALRYGCNKSVFELLVNYGYNFTDEFDILDDNKKEELLNKIPNCVGFFQHLKQFASQPRSLKALASLKLRRHLGVRLEAAVKELPLPEILKNLVRIQKMDVDV